MQIVKKYIHLLKHHRKIHKALLMDGSILEICGAVLTAVLGIVFFGCSLQGYCFARINAVQRLLMFVASLLMVYTGTMTDLVGIVVAVATLLLFDNTRGKFLATCVRSVKRG